MANDHPRPIPPGFNVTPQWDNMSLNPMKHEYPMNTYNPGLFTVTASPFTTTANVTTPLTPAGVEQQLSMLAAQMISLVDEIRALKEEIHTYRPRPCGGCEEYGYFEDPEDYLCHRCRKE